ncbi:MAG: translation initiation factor IF-3 C-terminal domain-containing protein, partial [Lactobacillus iners]|nr:translation initiation factor IF-3 C-terminal domain-containing protein [Lactobacillus iners]
ITHNELGKEVLEKMAEQAKDLSSVTASPTMEGRSMFLILSPLSDKDKKKK